MLSDQGFYWPFTDSLCIVQYKDHTFFHAVTSAWSLSSYLIMRPQAESQISSEGAYNVMKENMVAVHEFFV